MPPNSTEAQPALRLPDGRARPYRKRPDNRVERRARRSAASRARWPRHLPGGVCVRVRPWPDDARARDRSIPTRPGCWCWEWTGPPTSSGRRRRAPGSAWRRVVPGRLQPPTCAPSWSV